MSEAWGRPSSFVGKAILPADSLSGGPAACTAARFFDPAVREPPGVADDSMRSSAPGNKTGILLAALHKQHLRRRPKEVANRMHLARCAV
jgi:hypothetical protein